MSWIPSTPPSCTSAQPGWKTSSREATTSITSRTATPASSCATPTSVPHTAPTAPAEDDTYYWRIAHVLFPFYAVPPQGAMESKVQMNAYVPMDDEHTLQWEIMINVDEEALRRSSFGTEMAGTTAREEQARAAQANNRRPGAVYLPQTSGWYGRFKLDQDLSKRLQRRPAKPSARCPARKPQRLVRSRHAQAARLFEHPVSGVVSNRSRDSSWPYSPQIRGLDCERFPVHLPHVESRRPWYPRCPPAAAMPVRSRRRRHWMSKASCRPASMTPTVYRQRSGEVILPSPVRRLVGGHQGVARALPGQRREAR